MAEFHNQHLGDEADPDPSAPPRALYEQRSAKPAEQNLANPAKADTSPPPPEFDEQQIEQFLRDRDGRQLQEIEDGLGFLRREISDLETKRGQLRARLGITQAEKDQIAEDGRTLLAYLQQIKREAGGNELREKIGGRDVAVALHPYQQARLVAGSGRGSARTYRAK